MSKNRKIVHDIKGKMTPLYTLAQCMERDGEISDEMMGIMKSCAKQGVIVIPQIIELLDKIE